MPEAVPTGMIRSANNASEHNALDVTAGLMQKTLGLRAGWMIESVRDNIWFFTAIRLAPIWMAALQGQAFELASIYRLALKHDPAVSCRQAWPGIFGARRSFEESESGAGS